MKIKELIDICNVSGIMSNNSYRDFLRNSSSENTGIELRDSEVEVLKKVMKCDGNFRKALHALRKDHRSVYKEDEDYDRFIEDILEADKEYEDTQFRTFMIENMIRHSGYYPLLKNPSIDFFRIAGIQEDSTEDRKIWFRVQGSTIYPEPYYYEESYYNKGEEIIIPEVKDMYIRDYAYNRIADNVALLVWYKDRSIKFGNSRYIKTKKDLASKIKKTLKSGVLIDLIYTLDDVVEVWNMEV